MRHSWKQHAAELARLPECEIAYVCDPDSARAAEVASDLVAKKRPEPKTTQDLRKVLEDRSVSAVFIATPNHWHALAAIWAMQAGKDVYVEKPVSHNISEGRRMSRRRGSSIAFAREERRIVPIMPWLRRSNTFTMASWEK